MYTKKQKNTAPYTYQRAWDYSLWLLSRRPYSEKEIEDKLISKQTKEEDRAKIIAKLREYNFLNDQNFAQMIQRNETEFAKKGKLKVAEKLYKKGIPEEIRSEILESTDTSTEQANALYQLQKAKYKWEKFDTEDREQYFKLQQKMLMFLANKGFDLDTCKISVEEYIDISIKKI
ncbi:MAG: regulatory protein RecX [Patescibacteria group bacterium]|nr:regulatory protein RecX [Patescibacteria group bacterium]